MSITISTCDQISKSPINTSKSKMLFSFSKSSRFPQRKMLTCDKFYDSNSINPSRSTTFGYGNKYDFTKQSSCAPPPNTYSLNDQFHKNLKKGFGFGQGRSEMLVTGPLMQTIRNKNPGPGTYVLNRTLSNKSFTLTGKLNREDKQKINVPGPGKYPTTFGMNQTGSYFLSKYKSSGVRNFSKLEDRCKTAQNRVPGPGHYDNSKTELSPTGRYMISKIHNCTSRKFDGFSGRSVILNKNTPGPGNYQLPSEFGYYMAKKAVKKHSSSKFEVNQENKENLIVTQL